MQGGISTSTGFSSPKRLKIIFYQAKFERGEAFFSGNLPASGNKVEIMELQQVVLQKA